MTKIMNIFKNRMFQAAVGMTVGTILYCAAIVFILDLGNFCVIFQFAILLNLEPDLMPFGCTFWRK